MNNELKEAIAIFQEGVKKYAAKEKISRTKLNKALEKAKANYSKARTHLTALEKEYAKLESQLSASRAECNDARKHMNKLHNAAYNMDLSSATDAVFYQDSDDVGYVVDGKEFYLEISDDGELNLTPWNKYRRDRKAKNEEVKRDNDEIALDENNAEISDEEFDQFYSNLVE